jgi:hypothetical protein
MGTRPGHALLLINAWSVERLEATFARPGRSFLVLVDAYMSEGSRWALAKHITKKTKIDDQSTAQQTSFGTCLC